MTNNQTTILKTYESFLQVDMKENTDLGHRFFSSNDNVSIIADVICHGDIKISLHDYITNCYWNHILDNISRTEQNNVSSEAFIQEMRNNGLKEREITRYEGFTRLNLSNNVWICKNSDCNLEVYPLESCKDIPSRVLPEGSAEDIAKFVFWFDFYLTVSRLERIRFESQCLHTAKCKKRELKIKKNAMETEIVIAFIEGLAEESLKEAGIRCTFSHHGGYVEGTFHKESFGKFDLSKEEALDLFKNADKMLQRMNDDDKGFDRTIFRKNYQALQNMPENETDFMSELRHMARVHLSKKGIYVAVSCKGNNVHIEAMQSLWLMNVSKPIEQFAEFVKNSDKVLETMSEFTDMYNFLNMDELGKEKYNDILDMPF